jgi:RimJ/RimL family protein N-acetyltransferase
VKPAVTTKTGIKVTLLRPNVIHAAELYQVIDASREHLKNLKWAADVDRMGVTNHLTSGQDLWLIRINYERIVGCLQFWEEGPGVYSIGYWVGKDYAGQGITKAAVSVAMSCMSLDDKITAHVRKANNATRAVLRANGFQEREAPEDDWICYERYVGRSIAKEAPSLKITDAQHENLRWLYAQGGSGVLDKHSRVMAAGETRPRDSWPSWLRLMIHGLVAGQDGRIVLTALGKEYLLANP